MALVAPPPSIEDFPTAPTPRARLIAEALACVRAASHLSGVTRIAPIGSLTTAEPEPKDVDLLATVTDDADLGSLAALGRKLNGHTQAFNRGGEIFLANEQGTYLGRICPWKRCGPGIRASCDAWHCGRRHYLYDDFGSIRLARGLVAAPPVELWPMLMVRAPLPDDIEVGLLAPLRAQGRVRSEASLAGS